DLRVGDPDELEQILLGDRPAFGGAEPGGGDRDNEQREQDGAEPMQHDVPHGGGFRIIHHVRMPTWAFSAFLSRETLLMNVVVTGGTGNVGSQVVNELVARGATVTVVTRDPAKAQKLPKGVTPAKGNLAEPSTVRQVFDGADAVFLLNVVSPTESHEGL